MDDDPEAGEHVGVFQETLRRRVRLAVLVGLIAGCIQVTLIAPWTSATGAEVTPPTPASREAPDVRAMNPEAEAPRSLASALREHMGMRPAGPLAAAPPPPSDWSIPASQIDLRAATLDGDHLVQRLPDGATVTFTLDPRLQRVAQRRLEGHRVAYGAVVAMDPRTGAILALAEHAEGRPEATRMALQAQGPAASLFKLVSTAALVESGGLEPTSEICTHGGHRKLTAYHLQDSPKRDKRCESLALALGRSSNVAFARWADRTLSPDILQEMADRFLFNRRLPFLWGVGRSKATIPRSSRLGMARAAAGFEGTTLSPLHAALLASAIANDGVMMAPRLVAQANFGEHVIYETEHAELARVLDRETADAVTEGMVMTTSEGSAAKFFHRKGKARLPGMAVAGKTGHLSRHGGGVSRYYSWFVAFAPAEAPEIAIASLVVNGKQWTTKGVVPARAVLETWHEMRDGAARTSSR